MKRLNKKMRIILGTEVMLFIGVLLVKIVSRKKQDTSVPLDKDFDFVKIKGDKKRKSFHFGSMLKYFQTAKKIGRKWHGVCKSAEGS